MEISSQIVPIVNDIQLTATLPNEMVTSQSQLIDWCDQKISFLRAQSSELEEAYLHAKEHKWKFSTLQSQFNKYIKRISYYEKIKSALVAGYYIIPNFPVTMFAIRTKKDTPDDKHEWRYWADHTQYSQELPQTVGEYKNPEPIVMRIPEKKDSSGKILQDAESFATDWDEIDFPVTMAKPYIMEATSQAMALKIFDQFGIMPAKKKEDPVIIGQIKMKSGYNTKIVSFMIAWHLNTNVL